MLALLAAAASWPPRVWWWPEFTKEYKRCGVVFNVDGPGAPGDGILLEKDYSGLILSRNSARPAKPIQCMQVWAKKAHVKIRYKNF